MRIVKFANFLLVATALFAQAPTGAQDAASGSDGSPAHRSGVHLYRATFDGTYYSALPGRETSATGYDVASGGSATLGWSRVHSRSSAFVTYTGSYVRDMTRSELNSLNHNVSLAVSYALPSRWRFTAAVQSQVANTNQYLFEPNRFTQITAAVNTADDLAAALFKNAQPTNAYLAALLTGAPVLESPARQVFFGNRIFTAAVDTTLTYKARRLSVSFVGNGGRIQTLTDSSVRNADLAYLVPASTTARAGVNLNYSLSPRTEIGVTISSQRTRSRLADVYSTLTMATLGRKMSRRWFVEAHGGTGFYHALHSPANLPSGPQVVAGGSLGLKTLSHTFLLAGDRNVTDLYGFGSSSNVTTTAAWNWAFRNRSWRLVASSTGQQIRTDGLPNITAYLATAGIVRQVTRRTSLNVLYAFMRTGSYLGLPDERVMHAVRMSFVWSPSVGN
jgi:hypothetical protein